MPLYEYICNSCQHVFDEFSSIADRNLPTEKPCPSCGEMSVTQKVGVTPLADPVRLGRIKAPEGFRDVLRNVKKNTYGCKFNVD
jgi:putative FmdB family regulatory protein